MPDWLEGNRMKSHALNAIGRVRRHKYREHKGICVRCGYPSSHLVHKDTNGKSL